MNCHIPTSIGTFLLASISLFFVTLVIGQFSSFNFPAPASPSLEASKEHGKVMAGIQSLISPHSQTASILDSDSSLVAHYTFDDTNNLGADSSGKGNNGTLQGANGLPTATAGKVGSGALQFDGVDDALDGGNIAAADNTSELTVTTWVKLNTNHSPNFLSKFQNGQGTWVLSYPTISRAFNCRMFNAAGDNVTRNSSTFPSSSHPGIDGKWHFVACVYNGSSLTLNVDGVNMGSASLSGPLKDRSDPVCLGSQSSLGVCNAGNKLNGSLDDVRIYNRALSPQEITSLYCLGEASSPSCGGPLPDTSSGSTSGNDQTPPADNSNTTGQTPADTTPPTSGTTPPSNPPSANTLPQDYSGYKVTPISIKVNTWQPITGIPEPSFGIKEDVSMYVLRPGETCSNTPNKCYDYGNGPEVYHLTSRGEPYTHYVDNTSPNAVDSGNPYGTPEKPRQSGPTSAKEGSVVYFNRGTYSYNSLPGGGKLAFSGKGTASRPIFFRGSGLPSAELPVITTRTMTVAGSYIILENIIYNQATLNNRSELIKDSAGQIIYPSTDHLVFRNLEIKGTGSWMTGTALNPAGAQGNYDNVIYHNSIHDLGDWRVVDANGVAIGENDMVGITIPCTGSRNIWVVDNDIYHMGGDSIRYGCNYGPTDPASNTSGSSWVASRDININQSLSRNIFIGRNHFHDNHENAVDIKYGNNSVISENTMHGFKPVTSSSGEAVVVHYEPSNVWFINNHIYDATYGIISTGVVDMHAIGNVIHDVNQALAFRGNGSLDYVSNTLLRFGHGIYQGGSGNPRIVNNIFADYPASAYAINISDTAISSQAYLANNLFSPTGSNANIKLTGISGSPFSTVESLIARGKCSGCVQGDPAFVNLAQNDFHLGQNSPAIDAGDVTVMNELASRFQTTFGVDLLKDFSGNRRPQGAGWDIGAYEYCTGSSCTQPPASTICNNFTYSSWGMCTNATQSRTIISSLPAGCVGGNPILTQACTAVILTGDFNNDGLVNSVDFSALSAYWNQSSSVYDLTGDNLVNTLDYVVLVKNWSK